ncbi:MAG: hypothetical protein FJ291_25780 [Planctomycetes bacterium]|nr:hypothetical protein [Planctomycetota bacterium]
MGAPPTQAALRRLAVTRRIIYLLVAVAVAVPSFCDLGCEFKPSPWVEKIFKKVESLKPGSPILLSFDFDPAAMEELYPMGLALLRHCFQNDLHPILMTHWPGGVGISKQIIEKAAKERDKLPGRDYVFLAFKPGYSNLVLNMGESLQGAFSRDFYNQPTAGMPALEGVRSLKDISLVVGLAAGATTEMWIAYGRDRFGFDLGAGCTAVITPDLYPFLNSGQLIGVLGGLRGAADYEKLVKRADRATKGMQAQSLTHVLIILLILGANAHYLWRRTRPNEKG